MTPPDRVYTLETSVRVDPTDGIILSRRELQRIRRRLGMLGPHGPDVGAWARVFFGAAVSTLGTTIGVMTTASPPIGLVWGLGSAVACCTLLLTFTWSAGRLVDRAWHGERDALCEDIDEILNAA